MPIDPNIPLGIRTPQIQLQNPVAQYAQAQDIGLNALKMQEAQQSMANRNMLRSLDPSSPDYINQVSKMDPKLGLELQKGRTQARTAEIEQLTKIGGLMKNYASRVVANPNLETALSVVQQFGRDTGGDMSDEIARLQTIGNNPDALRQWGMGYAMDADKILSQTTLSAYQKQNLGVQMRGQDLVDARTRESQAMQFNPQLQSTIAQAKEYGQNLGKNRALAEAALPGAIQTADESIRLIDEMVGKAPVRDKSGKVIEKGTAPHPGFKNYVGAALVPGMRFVEGSDTASFEIRQKQIEGKAFLEAFNALKGGGSITEKEGEKGTQAIMRMNKASSEREYVAAARELQGILRAGRDRARTKAGGGATAAPSGGGNVIDFNSLN